MRLKVVFAGFFLTAALAAHSQTVPDAYQDRIPLMLGAGFSQYDADWSGYIDGATLWIDVPVYHLPALLDGLGIEIEGRDLNYARTGNNPRMREDTAEGGPYYRWNHYRNFRPYAKFLVGYGSVDFNDNRDPFYTHDTRTVLAPGGGIEYRLWRNLWLRGDYEYQMWPQFYARGGALTPSGYTVGAEYDLHHLFRRR